MTQVGEVVGKRCEEEGQRGGGAVWWYVAAVVGIEYALAGAGPATRAWAHAALLVALVLRMYSLDRRTAGVVATLALLPLGNVLAVLMPAGLGSPLDRLTWIGAAMVLAVVLTARALDHLPIRGQRIQARREALLVPVGLMLGVLIAGALATTMVPTGALDRASEALLVPILQIVFVIGLSEELLYRGLLLTTAIGRLGVGHGIVLAGVTYGLMHLASGSWLVVVLMTLVGCLFGWIVYATRSMVAVVVANGLVSCIMYLSMSNVMGTP